MKLRTLLIMGLVLIALGTVYYFSSRPEPVPEPEPRPFVWSVETDELRNMAISLPPQGKSQAWVVHDDKYWYFDEPGGPKVDMKRWGGGVPLLMSGPGADRIITSEPTDEQLVAYGLKNPRMTIHLVLKDERIIDIEVGDATPTGGAYYVRLIDSRVVYTVDYTWYEVLEGLVLRPPYPEPAGK